MIFAGDIVTFTEIEKRKDFFDYISDNFKLTYWLPGNHEYYYSDVERSISDFQVIKFKDHFFSASNFNQLHSDSLDFIKKELAQYNPGKMVVVTHHVPTFLNFPSQHKASI